jgi:hypothetical protein
MRPSLLLLATSFALGCAVDSTGPPAAPLLPRLVATTAGPEFPNVVRFQGEFVFAIADTETDLFVIAGLPDDPTQSAFCGGDEPFAIVDFQEAGVQQGVIHALVKGDEVNLHVYQFSTFVSPCVSTPIAVGTGRIMYLDNDVFVTGSGANSWGFRIGGEVSLVGGGTAHLMAHNRFQILPDGTFRRVFRQVRLN